jgi:hypothetical protein
MADPLDDQLAEFTERLLSGEASDMLKPATQDRELFELQATVMRLKTAFGESQQDEVMARRIKRSLIAEWERSGLDAKSRPFLSQWTQGPASSRSRQFVLFALAVAAVAVLVIVPLITPAAVPVTGAAEGRGGVLLPMAVFVGLVVITGLVWRLTRHKR